MKANRVLSGIPEKIQARYDIGETVKVEALTGPDSPYGGGFRFINRAGQLVEVDAVEFFGQGIYIDRI